MILAIDVHYNEQEANIAGILFKDWQAKQPDQVIMEQQNPIAPYQPGQFYKRELPCILKLLNALPLKPLYIVIDGYVTLGAEQKSGLGMHLYETLEQTIPIIGVAKNEFIDTPVQHQLLRGRSKNPLYITTAGIPLDTAKAYIQSMHGKFRIPTLLRAVDRLCRQLP